MSARVHVGLVGRVRNFTSDKLRGGKDQAGRLGGAAGFGRIILRDQSRCDQTPGKRSRWTSELELAALSVTLALVENGGLGQDGGGGTHSERE
jgi:hypothetical protein